LIVSPIRQAPLGEQLLAQLRALMNRIADLSLLAVAA